MLPFSLELRKKSIVSLSLIKDGRCWHFSQVSVGFRMGPGVIALTRMAGNHSSEQASVASLSDFLASA